MGVVTGEGPVLVVADDLTGANATAAALARGGMRAVTVTDGDRPEVIAEFVARFDAVVVSTNSRHASPDDAAGRLRRAIRGGWPTPLAANRIDSTLRGNVGATTAALLSEVAELSGRRTVALCIPAHPDAGRQTVGGVQLLNGRRLEDTELAQDPRTPVTHSDIAELLAGQADVRVAALPLDTVTGSADVLAARLHRAVSDGADVIVADALTADNIVRVTRAAAEVSDVTWVTVDPGPATVAMATALGLRHESESAPVLAVSGSATALTRHQLARLRGERDVALVRPVCDENAIPDVDASSARLVDALTDAGPDRIVLLASVVDDTDVVEVSPDAAERIPGAIARTVRRALELQQVDGIFATGGDISAALFTELAANGLDVERELMPLAVAGQFVGGPWSGLPVATKGGLVGDTGAIVTCVDYLRHAAENRRRRVHPAQSRASARRP